MVAMILYIESTKSISNDPVARAYVVIQGIWWS